MGEPLPIASTMEQYVIYGSGKWGRYAFFALHEEKNILFFVDRDERKWGTSLFGRWIYSPEVLGDYPDVTVCIAVENSGQIREYLYGLGARHIVSYVLHPEDDKVPCIIYGSGRNAEEFCKRYGNRFCFAFLVDDERGRLGRHLCGMRVYPPEWMRQFPGVTVVDATEEGITPQGMVDEASRDCMVYRPGRGLLPMLPHEERQEPAILVDVTIRRKRLPAEGVARVSDRMFETMRALRCHVIPVRNMNGTLVTDMQNFGLGEAQERIVKFVEGDIFYLLDPTWNDSDDFRRYICMAQERGAKVYAIVHDFLPAYYPECFTESIAKPFFAWHDMILPHVDGIVCDSVHTADVAGRYFHESGYQRDVPLEVYPVHLGTDFPREDMGSVARPFLVDFVEGGKTFLMVGTLEPRKGHKTVLEAFQILWKREPGLRLLFLGHDGWLNAGIKESMEPYLGSKVLWVKDATDAELQWAYGHACALIAASLDEGFGLPLIEAAAFGLPILCSDIDVFYEIAQGNAFYIPAGDSEGMAAAIWEWMCLDEKPDSRRMKIFSWKDSVERLLDVFSGRTPPCRTLL